jgi:hypothetical protein
VANHAPALESLARRFNQSPLDVLEFFNERAAIRQHEGNMPRGAAEEWAVEDCRAYFAMRASGLLSDESKRSARSVDATELDVQSSGACKAVAIGEP